MKEAYHVGMPCFLLLLSRSMKAWIEYVLLQIAWSPLPHKHRLLGRTISSLGCSLSLTK